LDQEGRDVSNRHLLLAVVGLSVLCALLFLLLLWREGANATRIADLSNDLRGAREKQQTQHDELRGELQKTNEGLRDEIKKTRADLTRATTSLDQTRASLNQTSQNLQKTQGELAQARQALAVYKTKPWLNQSGNQEPWKANRRTGRAAGGAGEEGGGDQARQREGVNRTWFPSRILEVSRRWLLPPCCCGGA
jgi:septal ring factor EnvC (AmiA/AmiB activator)